MKEDELIFDMNNTNSSENNALFSFYSSIGKSGFVSYKTLYSTWEISFRVRYRYFERVFIFRLYANDICNLQLHSNTKITLHADDTAVFHHGKGYTVCECNLQKDCSSILKWLKYNGLFLNANKTKTIHFGSKRKIQNNNICTH